MAKFRKSRLFRVAHEMVRRFFDDGVSQSAAELAYYLLFSLFPLLIFLNSLIGMLQIDVHELMRDLGVILPQQILAIITDYVEYVSSLQAQTLAYAGLVLGIWSMSRSINSMLRSVAQAYRVELKGLLSRALPFIMALLLMVSVIVLLILLLISKTLLATVSRYFHLPIALVALWNLLKFIALPAFIFFVLTGFYYIASQRRHRIVQAMPGALFCCVIWTIFSAGFSYYVANFGRYSILYGSLGAIIILMLWLYATGLMFILGGELNHTLIEQRNSKGEL